MKTILVSGLGLLLALTLASCGGGTTTVTASSSTETSTPTTSSTASTSTTSSSSLTPVTTVTAETVNACLKDAGFDSNGVKPISAGIEAVYAFSPSGVTVGVAVLPNTAQAHQLADQFSKKPSFTTNLSADGKSVVISQGGDLTADDQSAIANCTAGSG